MSEPIKVTIRRNIDRLTRVYIDDNSWEDDYSAVFQWTDGNYGCDCNRSLFFGHAAPEEPKEEDNQCGTTRYSIRLEHGDRIIWDELTAPDCGTFCEEGGE